MKAKSPIAEALRRQIEVRAYLIWEGEGRPEGREKEHWHRAEAEIMGAKPAKKASRTKAKPSTNGAAKAAVAAKRTAKPKPAKHAGQDA